MSGPVVKDGRALRDYLVRLAMEAFDGTMGGRLAIETAVRERMAQAAQTIVCEVAEIERRCQECGGSGGVDLVGDFKVTCDRCDGTGEVAS